MPQPTVSSSFSVASKDASARALSEDNRAASDSASCKRLRRTRTSPALLRYDDDGRGIHFLKIASSHPSNSGAARAVTSGVLAEWTVLEGVGVDGAKTWGFYFQKKMGEGLIFGRRPYQLDCVERNVKVNVVIVSILSVSQKEQPTWWGLGLKGLVRVRRDIVQAAIL